MARVRSGQAFTSAWPLVSDRSIRRGSRVKRDLACTFTRHFSLVLVVLRSQSRLRLEGRTRTLSGPSPDLSSAGTLAPSACRQPDLLYVSPSVPWLTRWSPSTAGLRAVCPLETESTGTFTQ